MRVSLLITCLVDLFQPEVGEATVRALRAAGCSVSCPMGQTCCGQPAWNAGFANDAALVARTTLEALEADLASGSEAVVVPAGSCATMVKVFWPELFEIAGDHDASVRAWAVGERTFELSSFLAGRDIVGLRPLTDPPRVAYHHSCHMLRELRLHDPPLQLLERLGCTVVDWPDAERCCGFGGLFSVKLPEASVAMADTKLGSIPAEATLLCGSDGSCLMHLAGRASHEGQLRPTRHLALLISDALDGGG